MRMPLILLILLCIAWSSQTAVNADPVGQRKVPFMVEPATGKAFYAGRGSRIRVYRAHPRMHIIKIKVAK